MRVDKFLKATGVIKRRTIANQACDADRVTVNGRPAKASYNVKIGDILELRLGGKQLRVEVLLDIERPRAREEMFRIITGNE